MSIFPILQLFALQLRREKGDSSKGIGAGGTQVIGAAVAAVTFGGDNDVAFRGRNGIIGKIENIVSDRASKLKLAGYGIIQPGNCLSDKAQGVSVGVLHCGRPRCAVIVPIAPAAEIQASGGVRSDTECLVIQRRSIKVCGKIEVVTLLIPAAGGVTDLRSGCCGSVAVAAVADNRCTHRFRSAIRRAGCRACQSAGKG